MGKTIKIRSINGNTYLIVKRPNDGNRVAITLVAQTATLLAGEIRYDAAGNLTTVYDGSKWVPLQSLKASWSLKLFGVDVEIDDQLPDWMVGFKLTPECFVVNSDMAYHLSMYNQTRQLDQRLYDSAVKAAQALRAEQRKRPITMTRWKSDALTQDHHGA